MKKSLVNKIGIGIAAGGIAFGASSLDVNAQRRNETKFPDKHSHGAEYVIDDGKSQYAVEEKRIYGDRFYMHYREADGEHDLITNSGQGLAALDVNKTIPMYSLGSKEIKEMRSEGEYIYRQVKLPNGEYANKITVDLRVAGWCDDQVLERAGIKKGTENAIYQVPLGEIIPNLETMVLEDGTIILPIEVPDSLQTEGNADHYAVVINNDALGGLNPETKKLDIYAPVYRPSMDEDAGPVTVKKYQGTGTEVSRDEGYQVPEESDSTKTPKEKSLYGILGANTNLNFVNGFAGVQYGPFALVANAGMAKDEVIFDNQTDPSSVTGRYSILDETNTDINIKGIAAEVHPFHNKKVSPYLGIGVDNWKWTNNSSLITMDANDNEKTRNTDSKVVSENPLKGYGGLNFKVKNSQLGVQAGWDNKAKFNAGVRFTRKF